MSPSEADNRTGVSGWEDGLINPRDAETEGPIPN
jgi:hypothetical protein